MPTAADRLTRDSPEEEVKKAVSSCISQMMKEGGRSQEQCTAICYSIARKQTGRELNKKSTTIG